MFLNKAISCGIRLKWANIFSINFAFSSCRYIFWDMIVTLGQTFFLPNSLSVLIHIFMFSSQLAKRFEVGLFLEPPSERFSSSYPENGLEDCLLPVLRFCNPRVFGSFWNKLLHLPLKLLSWFYFQSCCHLLVTLEALTGMVQVEILEIFHWR